MLEPPLKRLSVTDSWLYAGTLNANGLSMVLHLMHQVVESAVKLTLQPLIQG
jgi:hypothetical protein